MTNLLIILLSSLFWRIRGGLSMPFTNKKFPVNKIWFSIVYGLCAGYLYTYDVKFLLCTIIATFVSHQIYGWGEAVACVLGIGQPDPERRDCELIDDIMDYATITIKGKTYKLIDYPILWGWCWVSLRGLISSFIIGLALNSLTYMISGLAMGSIYYLGGLIARKILPNRNINGWALSEWIWGAVLGLFLIICK